MDERLDRMLAIAEQQHATIAAQGEQIRLQAEQIGLLVQSVAMLLGEELGSPVPEGEQEEPRTDMDGRTY